MNTVVPSSSAARRYDDNDKTNDTQLTPKSSNNNDNKMKKNINQSNITDRPKINTNYEPNHTNLSNPKNGYSDTTSNKSNNSNTSLSSINNLARSSTANSRIRRKNSLWINEGNWKLGEKIGIYVCIRMFMHIDIYP
jgi:hypothetical protein